MLSIGGLLLALAGLFLFIKQWRRDAQKRQQNEEQAKFQQHKNQEISSSINVVQKHEAEKVHSTDYDNINGL